MRSRGKKIGKGAWRINLPKKTKIRAQKNVWKRQAKKVNLGWHMD